MLRVTLAAVHLLALGVGLGAVLERARALGERPLSVDAARRAFAADTWWAVAAGLWIVTGIWRLMIGAEKATTFYFHNHIFMAKMGFLALVLALEVWPMLTLIRWRSQRRHSGSDWQPDAVAAGRVALISYVEAALVVAMVIAAVAMARGYGSRAGA